MAVFVVFLINIAGKAQVAAAFYQLASINSMADLDSESQARARKLLSFLKAQTEATEFLHPVDYEGLGLYDYPTIVKTPMDLSNVERKLIGGQYSEFD